MTKILVLSDIHFPTHLKSFPIEIIRNYINDVDILFGLGDYDSQLGLDYLYCFNKEVYAVSGNMDDHIIKQNLSAILTVNIEEINIGLIHGWGAPLGLREKIRNSFSNVNVICYGHTHSPYFEKENDIFFFNPGSICGRKPSFGILKIDKSDIKGEIIYY